MVTVDPRKGLAPAQCNFSGAGAADPSTEYAGFCGVAPAGTSSQGVLNNVTAAVPVWLCPPTGYVRAPVGGEWAGGQLRGQGLTLEQCAAACTATVDCRAFAVSDASGCKLWPGKELSGFVPATNTSAFLSPGALPPPPPPVLPKPRPITLQRWTALRPSTGAQPAAFRGVLAPRMPAAVAAAWERVGLRPLAVIEHFATESTMPSEWHVYSKTFCHGIAPSEQHKHPELDCTLERTAGVFVHAYSTVAAGYDHANFGIDTLAPPVVPSPSVAGTGNVPLLCARMLNTRGVSSFND